MTSLLALAAHGQSRHQLLVHMAQEAAEAKKPRAILIGDTYNINKAIEAILLNDGNVFNQGSGGLNNVSVQVIDNERDAARMECALNANVALRAKPCAFGKLVKVINHLGPNRAPRLDTCLCTSDNNLRIQPMLVKPKLAHDVVGDDEPAVESEEIELNEIDRPVAPLISGADVNLYRSNGRPAKDYANLMVELIQSRPVQRDGDNGVYRARLWKLSEDGSNYDAYNHRAIYGAQLSVAKAQRHFPDVDIDTRGHPQVFRGIAPETTAGTMHMAPSTPPSARQRKLIDYLLDNAKGLSSSNCATFVKNGIKHAYGIPYTMCDAFEVDITYNLEEQGWVKLDTINPDECPIGCLVIYDSFAKRGFYKSRPQGRSPSEMRNDFPAKVNRSNYVPYYGHIEVRTDDPDFPFVSDFKQKSSIIAHPTQKNMSQGWGYNRTKSREYKVIGIYCKR